MNCKYCDNPGVGNTDPPLCEKHLDLAILAEYLADQGEPVTVESLKALRAKCMENQGLLAINDDDIEALFVQGFATRYKLTHVSGLA